MNDATKTTGEQRAGCEDQMAIGHDRTMAVHLLGSVPAAMAEQRLVVGDNAAGGAGEMASELATEGLTAAMAAPVHEHGAVVGSLVVASRKVSRAFSPVEQEMLLAFAEHASLALTDARTLEQLHDAYHDRLTGLPSKNLFLERLKEVLDRDDAGAAVVLLDLDRFGAVNETLGHEVGDRVLIEVAERIGGCVSEGDTVARFGADDFALLLADPVSRSEPEAVAHRIVEALRVPIAVEGREIALTISMGITVSGDSPTDLVREADIALYQCRRDNSARFRRFEPAMTATLVRHLELESDLQRALEREELTVHYQPVIALAARELVGFEALLRWQHPTRGLIPPLAFIPLAEELGLIHQIGAFVLSEACQQAARWQADYPADPPIWVSVNLSAHELQRPDIAGEIARVLAASDIAQGSLVIEITETGLMRDTDAALRSLEELRRLGVRLAIDDFGTGYSSLNYLHRFPLDMLKIAGSFIAPLARGGENSALVRTILELSAGFGLEVVAEGIETPRQLAELQRLGCVLGQGFHYSPPVAGAELPALLSKASSAYGRLGATVSQDFILPPRPADHSAVRRHDRRPAA